jgi:hypothetical protein
METEFESDGSDDDINDGGTVLIFTGLFLIDKDGEKIGPICNVLRRAHEYYLFGVRLLFVPHVQEKFKILSYAMKIYLSFIRAPFAF